MERHRCTKCRNPIRNVAVGRHGADDGAWYHPDCWDEVCSSEQERYERQVESGGLAALLAPYISAGPTSAAASATASASAAASAAASASAAAAFSVVEQHRA
jgi:hypothetical protein